MSTEALIDTERNGIANISRRGWRARERPIRKPFMIHAMRLRRRTYAISPRRWTMCPTIFSSRSRW